MAKDIRYWLMKSEPGAYSISDLEREKTAFWDGVRNYQARNYMMRDMRKGDLALFYHSNARPSGVAGVMKIHKEAQADPTSWDKTSQYYDPRSPKENPRWFAVTVCFVRAFDKIIPLHGLRRESALAKMSLLKKGQRLSVMPISEREYQHIVALSHR